MRHPPTITAWSCDTSSNGFKLTAEYVRSAGGEELTVVGPDGEPLYQNVSGAGKLLVTYDSQGTHYQVTDPLGTRRLQTDASAVPEMDFQELPYGDGLTSYPDPSGNGTVSDSSPYHFTGKERDQESGNDYFGARYYGSSMGRFLSPDWAAQEEPVPYAKLDDPQTLNLYSYVGNNPLVRDDPDGHAFGVDDLIGAAAGAVVGMATEAIKDVATGQNITAGGMAGAAVGGALFGEGIVNAPETLGGSVVAAAAAKGAVQGAVSNLVQQGVDMATGEQKSFSGKSLAISTGVGAVTAGIASKIPVTKISGISAGKGNMKAVAEGVRTKIANGTVSGMSLKTALKGAVGGQVANAGKTATETGADIAAKRGCNAATHGGCTD